MAYLFVSSDFSTSPPLFLEIRACRLSGRGKLPVSWPGDGGARMC